MAERLQKYLSRAGISSRRAGEKLIREGRVKVNGKTVTQMGVTVDPAGETIRAVKKEQKAHIH